MVEQQEQSRLRLDRPGEKETIYLSLASEVEVPAKCSTYLLMEDAGL